MFRKKLKLVLGNYSDVLAILIPTLYKSNLAPLQESAYQEIVRRDINRTRLYCSQENRDGLMQQLSATPIAPLHYLQGDFEARIFTEAPCKVSLKYSEMVGSFINGPGKQPGTCDLSFSYLNDDGVLCGFSIFYCCEETDKDTHYFLNLSVITNIKAPPNQREVMCLLHPLMTPPDADKNREKMVELHPDDIAPLVKQALRSESIAAFVQGTFDSTENAFLLCQELNHCFVSPDRKGFFVDLEKNKRVRLLFDSGFLSSFQALKEKASKLQEKGFVSAFDEMEALVQALQYQKQSLIDGRLSLQEFVKNTEEAIVTAQAGELKHHRRLIGKVIDRILAVLNRLTCGAVSKRPTDSLFKIKKTHEAVERLTIKKAPSLS